MTQGNGVGPVALDELLESAVVGLEQPLEQSSDFAAFTAGAIVVALLADVHAVLRMAPLLRRAAIAARAHHAEAPPLFERIIEQAEALAPALDAAVAAATAPAGA